MRRRLGNAVKVMRIATGEELTGDGKNATAVSLGNKCGKALTKGMTPERRAEIAINAGASRWRK
jgi:hypothetical protein